MNVSAVKTNGYENNRLGSRRENKPNQTQFQTQRPDGAAPKFLLFTLFDIPNMIYARRKNTLPTGSIPRIWPNEADILQNILERKMEV
ncbi:MAG: hypothetical protein ACYS30_14340 [Planctomycetota bacterium]